jgi:hypothetical protein
MLLGNQVVANVLGRPEAIEIGVVAQMSTEWVPPGGQHYLVMDLDTVIRREVESAGQVVFWVVGHH